MGGGGGETNIQQTTGNTYHWANKLDIYTKHSITIQKHFHAKYNHASSIRFEGNNDIAKIKWNSQEKKYLLRYIRAVLTLMCFVCFFYIEYMHLTTFWKNDGDAAFVFEKEYLHTHYLLCFGSQPKSPLRLFRIISVRKWCV